MSSSRLTTLTQFGKIGLIPLFYHDDYQICLNLSKTCIESGATIIEFLNRGPKALDHFKQLVTDCHQFNSETLLGAGSIVDAPTAALFIAAGAKFIVSPCFDKDTAILCNQRKIPYLPGCGTMSEIHLAESYGVEICKLFPGGQLGPSFVKAALGPCPWSSLMPTGGVEPTEASLTAWFEAGVTCVGIGSKLVSQKIIQEENFLELSKNIVFCLEIIRKVKRA